MKLVEQQGAQNYNDKKEPETIITQNTFKSQLQKKIKQKPSFKQPFQNFCNRIKKSIQITLIRFFVVICIYFKSDWFLVSGQNGLILPWSAMVFFLAEVIEIITLIGDGVLIKFLKKQKLKLQQIQQKRQEGIEPNIILKAAPYQYYLSDFQLTKCFKFTHKSYSSSFSIVKYMHLYCTFLIFGQMALRQQKDRATLIQYLLLWLFLASIYYTTFEMDWSVLQMSSGPYRQISQNQGHIQNISVQQVKGIQKIIKKQWRHYYIIISSIGSVILFIKLLIDFRISILLFFSIICLGFQLISFGLQNYIFSKLFSVISNLHRQKINPYFIISQTLKINKNQTYFRVFFSLQRFSILFLFMAISRQVLPLQDFMIYMTAVFMLFIAQRFKIFQGEKIRLLRIKDSICKLQEINKRGQQIQLQCSICIQKIQQNQIIKILPCSIQHIFHSECLVSWLRQKKQCPLCRFELKQYI